MNNITLSSFIVVMGMLACALHAQVIIQVPGEYPTIQAAVDAAYSGDTILVAPGTYQENIRIQGNDKIITLASNFIFSGDTTDINNTIIDGSNPVESDYGMVVLIKNQVASPSTKIMGFTITGGKGYYQTYGGGFYTSAAAPVIEYNHIQNCSVTGVQPNGAGIYIGNAAGNPSMICSINHNVIRNCTINTVINSVVANGAGISVNSVKAVIEENEIKDNIILGNSTASCSGGGIYYFGNIPEDFHPQLSIIHNEITYNRVESWQAEGGGVSLYGYTQYIIEGNIISSNEAASTNISGYALGGGLDIFNPGPGSVISNNIISYNHSYEGPYSSARFGGGIYLTRNPNQLPEIYPLIEKNRITGNTASYGAGIAFVRTGARLINNFISGNMALMAGGAVYFCGPADTALVSEVINNTITQNSASSQEGKGGSIYYMGEIKVLLMNDIF